MSGLAELTSSNQVLSARGTAGQGFREFISGKVVGQSGATKAIILDTYSGQSRLASARRRAGFGLLTKSATALKVRMAEAVAKLLNDSKLFLKIDCGEFQPERETAKLIGTPPGDLGHREAVPMLTQQCLEDATSANSNRALVLCDAIEKASASLTLLLQRILDRATIRLSTNPEVNFPNSLIFLTGKTSFLTLLCFVATSGKNWFLEMTFCERAFVPHIRRAAVN